MFLSFWLRLSASLCSARFRILDAPVDRSIDRFVDQVIDASRCRVSNGHDSTCAIAVDSLTPRLFFLLARSAGFLSSVFCSLSSVFLLSATAAFDSESSHTRKPYLLSQARRASVACSSSLARSVRATHSRIIPIPVCRDTGDLVELLRRSPGGTEFVVTAFRRFLATSAQSARRIGSLQTSFVPPPPTCHLPPTAR